MINNRCLIKSSNFQIFKLMPLLLIPFVFAACEKKQKYANADEANADFEKYKVHFIEDLWKQYPGWATSAGFHKYDSLLVVPDDHFRETEIEFVKSHLNKLTDFPVNILEANNRIDYYMMRDQLSAIRWSINEFKEFEWNPASYNVAGSFDAVLNGHYEDLELRLLSIGSKLKNVQAYYDVAKSNLTPYLLQLIADPINDTTKRAEPKLKPNRLLVERAILQNHGALFLIDSSLIDSINKSSLDQVKKVQLIADAHLAAKSIGDFINWMEVEMLSQIDSLERVDYRLDKNLYKAKFKHDLQAQAEPVKIYWDAIKDKKSVHIEMKLLADEIWEEYFPSESIPDDSLQEINLLIEKLSINHVHRDSLVTSIRNQIADLEKFVTDKNLLYLDPEKPLLVRETPVWMQGPAGASISSPGPYDANAETFYNVTPLTNYSNESAESYLREYNNYTMQILNIHEAVPGHYTQGIYANKSNSMIKAILGNGAMVEGWAVYVERMMMENGYGNNSPEMWLMYYKWHLREICNTIIDYGVHVEGWTQEKVMDILVNEAFQEQAEAAMKWNRVSETQVQLCSYYTGYKEIYNLREEMKNKLGEKFNLKSFHEKFLSYGSAPVKYIRMLMLEEAE